MEKTVEEIKEGQRNLRIPNLDEMYDDVVAFVKAHQGEKGYIDCQPYKEEELGDIIYTFVYNEVSGWGEERMVYGVRVIDEGEGEDLEICFEPYMRTYRSIYDDDVFRGTCEDPDANAEWYSVKWSDVYYIPTIFNIAETIWEYV